MRRTFPRFGRASRHFRKKPRILFASLSISRIRNFRRARDSPPGRCFCWAGSGGIGSEGRPLGGERSRFSPGERGAPAAFAGQPHNPGPWPLAPGPWPLAPGPWPLAPGPQSHRLFNPAAAEETREVRGDAQEDLLNAAALQTCCGAAVLKGSSYPGTHGAAGSRRRRRRGGSLLHAVHDLVRQALRIVHIVDGQAAGLSGGFDGDIAHIEETLREALI